MILIGWPMALTMIDTEMPKLRTLARRLLELPAFRSTEP
jgi:hypothetical protein